MTTLKIEKLNKSFGETAVLRDISLSVEGGEILALIGSSGGGKTTLLRCLNFLEMPDSGEIMIGDRSVFSRAAGGPPKKDSDAQRRIGLVFQQFHLFPQYSVKDNLTLAPSLAVKREEHGIKERRLLLSKIEERAGELLREMGLGGKEKSYPCELSGGQCQRVAIARALMPDPEILCFDEPTSALDPALTGEVLRLIRSLRAPSRAMIVVTHDIAFARAVSDRVAFIANGVVEEEGKTEEVFASPKSEKMKEFLSSYLQNANNYSQTVIQDQ